MTASIRLDALTSVHSHAFQRALRGQAQRPSAQPEDDFWSWRQAMYRCVLELDPERFEQTCRVAYRELAAQGVRTVGEFHYVHHQADGTPYAERTLLADIAIRVAREQGMRIALLRAAYTRAGAGREPEPGQRRFCDRSVDDVLRDVDTLRARYAGADDVRIGVAPHSTRAVPPSWLRELGAYAAAHDLPLHVHVAEQRREIEECKAETGLTPLELLAEQGCVSARFVAVHATHLEEHEARLLGRGGGRVCMCPTTERDLGDGLPDVGALRRHGVGLCTGIDSHVITDPLEELRSLETHERLRRERRITARLAAGRTLAEQLWHEGSLEGARALGFDSAGGTLTFSLHEPELELVPRSHALDAVVFGASSRFMATAHFQPECA